jgi:hypothetical protein
MFKAIISEKKTDKKEAVEDKGDSDEAKFLNDSGNFT